MKKFFLLFIAGYFLSVTVEAQQLTRIAVVDLPRVYTAFMAESRAVRDFEERSARVQADIDRMTAEIQALNVNKVNAQNQGNTAQALRYEAEANSRTDILKEYYRTKTAELESIRKSLTQSGAFLDQVYDEIRYVAESEGFSIVLNLSENTGVLWYNQTVDLTDKLIKSLMDKARR
jgi:outer membrane protein